MTAKVRPRSSSADPLLDNADRASLPKAGGKKKPFSAWLKKVTNIKGGSSSKRSKKDRGASPSKATQSPNTSTPASSDPAPAKTNSSEKKSRAQQEVPVLAPEIIAPAAETFDPLPSTADPQVVSSGNHSGAPTLATDPETLVSDAGQSKTGTTTTGTGGVSTLSGGGNSIFSSSNQSSRSLTTTLTTVQSAAPSAHLQNIPASNASTPTSTNPGHAHHHSQGSTYFSHQYPTTPLSAVPQHLQTTTAPSNLPTTYRSATANNLLTDNASILTLASSSHNVNRRGSLDTTASVRAIAPSSQWGGSRESLPLSVLSGNTEAPTSSHHMSQRPSVGGLTTSEAAGVAAPALSSERNSVYRTTDSSSARNADKTGDGASLRTKEGDGSSLRGTPDAASLRSGLGGHGRNNSFAGSIGGMASNAIASPLSTGAE